MENRVSNEQLEELLEFLAKHASLATGDCRGYRSKEAVDKLWNDLATKLNSYSSGSSKTGERWKKYWADLKHKSRTRLARWKHNSQGSTGSPDISDVDKKVLAIIGERGPPAFESKPVVYGTSENIITSEVVIEKSELHSSESNQSVEAPDPINSDDRPLTRPTRRPRLRLKRCRPATSRPQVPQPDVVPKWVIELERNRVNAENKMADAALLMVNAANKIADAALRQTEVMNKVVEVVGQLSTLITKNNQQKE